MTRRARRAWLASCLLAVATAACSSGGGGGTAPTAPVDPAEIKGVWRATKVEYVSHATGVSVDLVTQGGSAGIVLDADTTCRFVVISPGGDIETRTGTWRLEGNVLTMREEGTAFELRFDVEYTEPILRLTGADVEFDVNGDGSDEAADLNLELGR